MFRCINHFEFELERRQTKLVIKFIIVTIGKTFWNISTQSVWILPWVEVLWVLGNVQFTSFWWLLFQIFSQEAHFWKYFCNWIYSRYSFKWSSSSNTESTTGKLCIRRDEGVRQKRHRKLASKTDPKSYRWQLTWHLTFVPLHGLDLFQILFKNHIWTFRNTFWGMFPSRPPGDYKFVFIFTDSKENFIAQATIIGSLTSSNKDTFG